ncbi:hypothetical protein [Faecalibaculum rodentium]|uniref:hypothetical protein n=1 Tax=Faecalibaculum rodentium TaxID=1702221 RepID=UPI0023F00E81|nr:hypothetical protein [Faecalibaculum rodentium]
MFSAGNANPPLAAKCLRWAVCLLLIQSLLLLVFPNMLVSALLLAATMILMILAAWFDRQYILWLPLAALISEIQLFYLTASGALLIFYYILLIVNLVFLFAGKKTAGTTQLYDAAFAGKLCLLPLECIHIYLTAVTGVPVFLGIAYTMLLITSAYDMAGMYRSIESSNLTPKLFLIRTVLLLIPVCDVVTSFLMAQNRRRERQLQ